MALSRVATSNGQGSAASAQITLPAGTQAGDLCIVLGMVNNILPDTISIDQGYTEVTNSPQTETFIRSACFIKVLVGGDTAPTLTFSANQEYGWVAVAYRGASGTLVDSTGALDTGFSTNVPWPAANAGGTTVWSVLIGGIEGDFITSYTPPTNWTNLVTMFGGIFVRGAVLDENQSPGTGTITPGNGVTATGRNDAVFHLLIQASAAATPAAASPGASFLFAPPPGFTQGPRLLMR